ncbi:MAG: glycosyltransferase [Candidatus Competibacteraceae bacterium]|nr:glycosyltransferase [Candidatus Competibacteraceae bacterium]MCP5124406.1 glycosyltransferase [Gammaproteobacteria bacterium]
MIAYHFPPLAGSSGIQRTLRFVQHLPTFGWEPIVLTAHPRAYERTSNDLLLEVPEDVVVHRAFALDAARHLSIGGRYPRFLARPDRWMSWRWGAVAAGLRLIQRYQPAVLWSTYPIATAHQIGAILHQRSGLPWVADFRDPMAQEGYPAHPKVWQSFKAIEETAFQRAAYCVFTSPGAIRYYGQRYPAIPSERLALVENGYDEESFAGLDASAKTKGPLHPGRITLLHSGIVYPSERDPTQLFQGIGILLKSGQLSPARFILRLRATAHDDELRSLAVEYGITDVIELAPPLPYREALEEMLRADGLLVLQAANCNDQIPAKLYEYLRAGRPILGLTDPAGDTAQVLRQAGYRYLARLDSSEQIAKVLLSFLGGVETGTALRPRLEQATSASRRNRTKLLADLLENNH